MGIGGSVDALGETLGDTNEKTLSVTGDESVLSSLFLSFVNGLLNAESTEGLGFLGETN